MDDDDIRPEWQREILARGTFEDLVADLKDACGMTDPTERQLRALQAMAALLEDVGVSEDLHAPIREMFSDIMNAYLKRQHGGAVKSLEEISRRARAAATVTVLNERGMTVVEAIKTVSKELKLDRKKLTEFYDNLHRAKGAIPHAKFLYELYCREVRRLNAAWAKHPR